ncbi:hypothetical protein I862_04210 [endosymbiont of Acanthamoeba sp. UWC8]|uniref:hypothetical protein n=1 Tax=endosymbiont of Acanthamoeba sp. UWC8 TaxID=86106 RepID=UPI0004D1C564|nr:hypothetical protein [endosymbiont of Acanthamoeba sp. UWC8]AIF81402.1 hypothetical protein I862_04210 [endosymbiont of Acanthamoeba sp. UWC8]
MKNLSTKSLTHQGIFYAPIQLNLRLLENICIDDNPKIKCKKIYSRFLHKLNSIKTNNTVKQDSDALDYPSPDEIWDSIALEGNKKHNHIDFKASSIHKSLKGSFIVSSDGYRSPFKKVESIKPSDIATIAMGGIDFDTMEHFGALRKNLFQFYSCLGIETGEKDMNKTYFYFPLHTKEKRYHEILNFHTQPSYASEEMTELTLKYVLPKIEYEQPLSFFCFSASCRELMMIENVCKQYFKDKGTQEREVKRLMSYVNAVLVGYAFDWSIAPEEPGFSKLVLLSTEDFGILRPRFNRELVYGASCLERGLNLIQKSEESFDKALIFGCDTIPIQIADKVNWKGHSLPHYVHAFTQQLANKDKQELINVYCSK